MFDAEELLKSLQMGKLEHPKSLYSPQRLKHYGFGR
jgi:hypothetical protein